MSFLQTMELSSANATVINSLLSEMLVNLTEWQLSALNGLSETGVKCMVESWEILAAKPLQDPFCSPHWDGEYCWPGTPAGDSVIRSCRNRASRLNTTLQFKGKVCTENGTWSALNSTCQGALETSMEARWSTKEIVRLVLFIASVLSLVFLAIALFIFYFFKSIRCDRITVHIQFMLALLLKSVALVIISEPNLFGEKYYYRSYGWSCKLVLIIHLYSYLSSILWMLVQGHFLNSKLTTNIFKRMFHIKYYKCFGWGAPFVVLILWCSAMGIYHENAMHKCWKGYSKSPLIWIVIAPVLTALSINVLFLANIMRVLLRKSRLTSNSPESQQIRRASKATAALFPLLGINNFIFFFNPGGSGEAYYMITNAVLQPLQGVVVSILYCFICNDVKLAIRREWGRFSARKNFKASRSGARCRGELKELSSTQKPELFNVAGLSTITADIAVIPVP